MLAGCKADNASGLPVAAHDAGYQAPVPLPSAGPISDQAQRIFSHFHGRWANSSVRYIGKIEAGADYFEIYQFDFVNPESNHGTQLIALLWRGEEFAGRYAINGHASGTEAVVTGIEGSTIVFTCDDAPPRRVERITIDSRTLPRKLLLCGKEASLETDGI